MKTSECCGCDLFCVVSRLMRIQMVSQKTWMSSSSSKPVRPKGAWLPCEQLWRSLEGFNLNSNRSIPFDPIAGSN